MPFSLRFLPCALFVSLGALIFGPLETTRAQEAPSLLDLASSVDAASDPSSFGLRAGAPRLLRLIDAQGKLLQGNFSDPAWETRGGGLFFTREFAGTRNIWRAFPDPRDHSRYPSWRALPVTQFEAPFFASDPAPIAGDSALLMVSNAGKSRGTAQITLFDLRNQTFSTLTDEPNGAFDPAPAPDGSAFAYTALRSKIPMIVVQSLGGATGVQSEAVFENARRPAWQSATALLVESGDDSSIFRVSRPWRSGARPVRLAVGAQVSASRDGLTLVLAAKTGAAPQLYLLSGDGSGLRVLGSTEGADDPALSANGQSLAFAAPLAGQEARPLWVLSIQSATNSSGAALPPPAMPPVAVPVRIPPIVNANSEGKTRLDAPVAQIRGVQYAGRGTIAILGIAKGENASAMLEIGQGAAPKRWEARPLTLPLTAGAPLLLWNPPAAARGPWSFRLLVSNAAGAAQSVFSVQLPLPLSIPAPGDAVFNSMPTGGPLPRAPLPDLPAPPSLPRPAPVSPSLPSPQLSPAPPTPNPLPGSITDSFPPLQIPPPPSNRKPPPVARPSATDLDRDDATFNISNTLAEMRVGQTVKVTFWALNRGTRVWDTGTSTRSAGAVRLVTRWVRFDGGNRRKWALNWMKNPVAPGARTRWSFDLTAPPQPGRYKLIYGLVRLPSENWQPPAFNEPQETWPNEFAAIAFAVTVKP